MLGSSLDECIHSALCSLQLCPMVPIVILQSYPQRVCLINLGLFSLSASMFSYRCSSFILTRPRFFPMTITLLPGSACLVLVFMQFLPLCVHCKEHKNPRYHIWVMVIFRKPDCIHSQGESHGWISSQNMDHGGKVTAAPHSPLICRAPFILGFLFSVRRTRKVDPTILPEI